MFEVVNVFAAISTAFSTSMTMFMILRFLCGFSGLAGHVEFFVLS